MKLDSTLENRRKAPLKTPTGLDPTASREVAAAMNALLADVLCLYIKTKNFHWHVSGPNFRDYHLLFDEQAAQIFEISDAIAERVRKVGGTTIRSIKHISRIQRLSDNDADFVDAQDMIGELRDDNQALVASMRSLRDLCDDAHDSATASMLDTWIDEAERRIWFLFETSRRAH